MNDIEALQVADAEKFIRQYKSDGEVGRVRAVGIIRAQQATIAERDTTIQDLREDNEAFRGTLSDVLHSFADIKADVLAALGEGD